METVRCPSCGEENPSRFRLCGFCGTPLGGGAAPAPGSAAPAATPPAILPSAEVRKPATFIFVDLKGSTALTERIDQEAMSEIKRTYFTAMAAQIERHGGTIEKYIGDAIMAVFGIPKAHEDDALRAVRAAHGMQQELSRLNADFLPFYGVELANRTGVNTGEVVANTDPSANQQLATGDTVNVAARLEQAAPANEILIGETTYDLVRAHVDVESVEPLELKGKAERVPAYRLLAVRDATVAGAHLARQAPLIGRAGEMAQIRAAFRAVVAEGGGRLVTLVGEAGVGKSRLLDDLHDEVAAEAVVVRGRCLPYGDGITFWPVVEIVRDAAHIAADDAPDVARGRIADLLAGSPEAEEILDRVSSVIGLSASRYPVAEIFWAARRFLEVLAAQRPVLVLFEDIHYAEPTFLELLEHLVETLPDHAPVLILCAARLRLLDKRADWSTADRMSRLQLTALADTDTERLVEGLLGAPVAATVRSRIVAATEGNPLFTEQLVSMLVDKGHIRRTEGAWVPVDDVSTLAVPPTIQALLAARLDDLSREERATIEPASVIGLVFAQPAVAELVPEPVRPLVPASLTALDRKQLLQREDTVDSEDVAYRFRNLLIRDATYGSLLKRARAQMHERFVTWAERVNRERGREEEFEEILGYHLEQAYRYRTELGPLDAEGRTLAARAAAKLGNAGRRAFARGDLPAAASLLRRTVALLGPDDPVRIENQAELGEALLEAGDFAEATEVLDAAIAGAEAIGDGRLRARARLGRLGIALYAEELETGAAGRALDEATEAAALFERHADDAGVARAWRLVGSIHATSGRYEAAADAAQRVVEHATRAGDRRLASRAAAGYATIARAGALPADQVAERCGPLLDQVAGDRKAEAMILSVIAVSEAMQGRFDRARELHARAKTILGELGRSVVAASTSIEGSRIEMLAGDHAAAEALLGADSRELDGMGERYFRSTVVGLLAHALEAQGRLDEADSAVDLAATLTDEDDVESQMLWRTARAKVRARQGRGDDALALAAEALALAAETDDIDVQGDVHADYATVLRRLGRADEAAAHFELARDLYTRKGNVALAQVMAVALDGAGQPA